MKDSIFPKANNKNNNNKIIYLEIIMMMKFLMKIK